MQNWPTGPQPKTATVSPGWMFGVLGRHVAGREDVGQHDRRLGAQRVGQHHRANVGEGHAQVLRLAARVAAQEVRVAKDAGGRIAPQLLGHPGVRVAVVAERPEPVLAVPAAAARDREGHDHPLPHVQVADLRPNLDHDADGLVTQDVALLHSRNPAVVQVQVRAAHRGRSHLDDRILGVDDLRVGHSLDLDDAGRPPTKSLHSCSPP